MSTFGEHYSRLHDDELIHLALTRELTEEATTALQAELRTRGISDLDSHRHAYREEVEAAELDRDVKLAARGKAVHFRTWALCLLALFFCLLGVYLRTYPDPDKPHEWELIVTLGVATFLFSLLTSYLSRLWSKRVLYRKPPT
jgi:hypothetical protein